MLLTNRLLPTALILVFALLATGLPAFGDSSSADFLASGDRHWLLRSDRSTSDGKIASDNVEFAISDYENALKIEPDNNAITFKLIEALYFYGFFASPSTAKTRSAYDRSLELSEALVARVRKQVSATTGDDNISPEELGALLKHVPDAARAYFWSAINWGLWGMSHGYIASARKDVADKIDYYAKVLIAIDDNFADGGGYRIRGRLYTKTPRIPLFTSWIDRDEGIEFLQKAHTQSTKEVRNLYFLAEALLEFRPEDRDEALSLLKEACNRKPETPYLTEQTFDIKQSCDRLHEEES